MSTDYVPVNIPKRLYEEIERRVAESGGGFRTVEEYVEFVLTEVVKEEETENVSNLEEEKETKDKLKKLGYI